jgi:hypothetical protein
MTNPINHLIALLALFGRPRGSINIVIIQDDLANTPSARVQRNSPVGEALTNLTIIQEDSANTLSATHVQRRLAVPVAYEIE